MQINDIIKILEDLAAPALQEDYDNVGIITGNGAWNCTGVMISLDVTEEVIDEAIEKSCNLLIAHHPIVFKGLKKITGKDYVEKSIIRAIKHDIVIYAIHTNLDNVIGGVSGKMADLLGLINRKVLVPKKGLLRKMAVFVPLDAKEKLATALFAAGAGNIGNYSECSFSSNGLSTFRPGQDSEPHIGTPGKMHTGTEERLEVIFPEWLQDKVVKAMLTNHPYEEVAHDIYPLSNGWQETGSGIIGDLPQALPEEAVLEKISHIFKIPIIKHTALLGKPVKRLALCGGAGSFLTRAAISNGADMYITADIKYHEFFDAKSRLLLADIGHYESEQFTVDLLFDILREKFPNFAVLKTGINSNPVRYFFPAGNPEGNL